VAQSYFQQKDYKAAVTAANRLIKPGQKPSEDLLQLLLRSNYELKDAAGTSAALEQLLTYYPSPDTWDRLLDGYIQQTNHDHELLALYRLSEDVGSLTKSRQFLDMAQALYVGGFAIEAERVMDKGLAAGLFKGEELTRAQRTRDTAKKKADEDRKALAMADKSLAAAKTGDAAYKIGQLYFSAGKYAEAAEAMRKALTLPGLSEVDDANMEMGIALVRAGKKAEAIKAFDAVKDPKFAEVARLWKLRTR
jgi:tetratricopeptide (TPR) repeat protein